MCTGEETPVCCVAGIFDLSLNQPIKPSSTVNGIKVVEFESSVDPKPPVVMTPTAGPRSCDTRAVVNVTFDSYKENDPFQDKPACGQKLLEIGLDFSDSDTSNPVVDIAEEGKHVSSINFYIWIIFVRTLALLHQCVLFSSSFCVNHSPL